MQPLLNDLKGLLFGDVSDTGAARGDIRERV
jgi:hypothetical protein